MAQARAVVDVVGSKPGSHELLEEVGLFVAALGRPEPGQGIRADRITDLHQTLAGNCQRLFPAGFSKLLAPVGRHALEVDRLRCIGAANQGHGQAIGAGCVVEAEPALDAQAAMIGRTIPPFNPGDAFITHVIGELAAHPAKRAQRIDTTVLRHRVDDLPGARPAQFAWHQGTGRAGLDAFAAGHAGGQSQGIGLIEHDAGMVTSPGHADHIIDLLFATGPHAPAALNTGVQVDRHGRMRAIGLDGLARSETGT